MHSISIIGRTDRSRVPSLTDLCASIESFHSFLSNCIRWRVLLCIYSVEVGSVNACNVLYDRDAYISRMHWFLQCQRENVCATSHTHPRQKKKRIDFKTKMSPHIVLTRVSQPERVMPIWMLRNEGPIKCIFSYSSFAVFVRQQSWRSSVVSCCNVLGNFIDVSVKNSIKLQCLRFLLFSCLGH